MGLEMKGLLYGAGVVAVIWLLYKGYQYYKNNMISCKIDTDCPTNMVCGKTGKCQTMTSLPCMSAGDCPAGMACTNGVCSPN